MSDTTHRSPNGEATSKPGRAARGGPRQPSNALFIVSGGNGASGEQVVHTVLAQFPRSRVDVETLAYVRERAEIEAVVDRAAACGGTIVHTLVDGELRSVLAGLSAARAVIAIDLMGPLLDRLAEVLGRPPLGRPGLYRELHLDYFERVEAIEFALAHDDGMRVEELHTADIVLVGASRVGKTPLSIYLSVQGWRTANVALVAGISPPEKLFQIDRRRVVGLCIEPQNLIVHRRKRQAELGMPKTGSAYTDPKRVFEEVEEIERVFKKGRFATIDVSEQPIESSAAQVIELIRRRFGQDARRSSQRSE